MLRHVVQHRAGTKRKWGYPRRVSKTNNPAIPHEYRSRKKTHLHDHKIPENNDPTRGAASLISQTRDRLSQSAVSLFLLADYCWHSCTQEAPLVQKLHGVTGSQISLSKEEQDALNHNILAWYGCQFTFGRSFIVQELLLSFARALDVSDAYIYHPGAP
jgi:hypothetical protein